MILKNYLHCGGAPATHSRTEHLFTTTYCQNLSVFEKITILFFHVLTLGIPLAIYHIVQHVNFAKVRKEALESIEETRKDAKPYAPGFNALDMAKKYLQKMAPLNPCPVVESYKVNPVVSKALPLIKRAADYKRWELESLLKKHGKGAWENNKVLKVAHEAMKLAYIVACLTYDDLPAFQSKGYKSRFDSNKKRCKLEILTTQHSYHTFGYQPVVYLYHTILRTAPIWAKELCNQKMIPAEWSAKFYTPKTIQNRWRQLFNAVSDHAAEYIDLKKMQNPDRYGHGNVGGAYVLPKDLDLSFKPMLELVSRNTLN